MARFRLPFLDNLSKRWRGTQFSYTLTNAAGARSKKRCACPFCHRTAAELYQEIGHNRWQSGFSFSFVRNPWDKVVPHYHWRVRTDQTDLAANPIPSSLWVEKTYGNQDPTYYEKPKMFMPQTYWLSVNSLGNRSKIIADFVGRFECLQQDFEHIWKIARHEAPP